MSSQPISRGRVGMRITWDERDYANQRKGPIDRAGSQTPYDRAAAADDTPKTFPSLRPLPHSDCLHEVSHGQDDEPHHEAEQEEPHDDATDGPSDGGSGWIHQDTRRRLGPRHRRFGRRV